MAGSGRGMIARGDDQFAAAQGLKGDLDCAFGEAGRVGKRSYTRGNRSPFLTRSLSVKIQIDQIGGWLLIVPDQVAHQDVENVVVDGNGLFEARHFGRVKDEDRRIK
jgi:hypothetical protein